MGQRNTRLKGEAAGALVVKLLTEYLERAIQLERLAASEPASAFKERLLQQAEAYRKLAVKRAQDYGLPPPSPPEKAT